ncbi:MAG: glycosyltransferase [Bacteroidales bacterium]
MRNRDIVITGLQSWDLEIGSNSKNIAQEFARHNRVLYVNPPRGRLEVLRQDGRDRMRQEKRVTELALRMAGRNLWVYDPPSPMEPVSRLPIDSLFDQLNRRNNRRFARDIQRAMAELGFRNHIHFCDSDMFRSLHLKEFLNPEVYVYYSRDNLREVKFWQMQGQRIEPRHMAGSDLVVANSLYLAELAREHNPRSFFVGQGCDFDLFAARGGKGLPEDMQALPRPLIGYTGVLSSLRLDPGLLEHIARTRTDWTLVLVGPQDKGFQQSVLHRLPNVHFLGGKPPRDLPAYIRNFDVALNPQLLNPVTIGNYPRKIDEYLVAGVPVVATRTKSMEYFRDYVALVETREEWVAAIAEELASDSIAKAGRRVAFAGQHTWTRSVEAIYSAIAQSKQTTSTID